MGVAGRMTAAINKWGNCGRQVGKCTDDGCISCQEKFWDWDLEVTDLQAAMNFTVSNFGACLSVLHARCFGKQKQCNDNTEE